MNFYRLKTKWGDGVDFYPFMKDHQMLFLSNVKDPSTEKYTYFSKDYMQPGDVVAISTSKETSLKCSALAIIKSKLMPVNSAEALKEFPFISQHAIEVDFELYCGFNEDLLICKALIIELNETIDLPYDGDRILNRGGYIDNSEVQNYLKQKVEKLNLESLNTTYDQITDLEELLTTYEHKNLILQGVSGTGKSFLTTSLVERLLNNEELKVKSFQDYVQLGRVALVVPHNSYTYDDFVQGFKPYVKEDQTLGYHLLDGPFKELCQKAMQDPTHKYFCVIEHIDFGKIGQIFGDLLPYLKDKYRGPQHSLVLQNERSNALQKDGESPKPFYIPENVYIIGTISSLNNYYENYEQNAPLLWQCFEIYHTKSLKALVEDPIMRKVYAAVERFIEKNLTKPSYNLQDLMIGHSYFMVPKEVKDLETWRKVRWDGQIKHLLREYYQADLVNANPPEILEELLENFKD